MKKINIFKQEIVAFSNELKQIEFPNKYVNLLNNYGIVTQNILQQYIESVHDIQSILKIDDLKQCQVLFNQLFPKEGQ